MSSIPSAQAAEKAAAFHVSRDPHPAPPAVKIAVAQASKRAGLETAEIKAKHRPGRVPSR
jgi:hypothetical protein